MAEPFRLRALSASIGVNGMALLLALNASADSVRPWPGTAGLTGSGHGGGWLVFDAASGGGMISDDGPPTCPGSADLDRPAVPLFPILGADPRSASLAGDVRDSWICLQVSAGGAVVAAFFIRGSGDARNDRALLRRVRQLRFVPARRAGRAVASWGMLRLDPEAGSTQWLAQVAARARPPLPALRTD